MKGIVMSKWLSAFENDKKRIGNLLNLGFSENDILRSSAKMERLLVGNRVLSQDSTETLSCEWFIKKMDGCIDKHRYNRDSLYEFENHLWLYEKMGYTQLIATYRAYLHLCIKRCNNHKTPYVYVD